MNNNQPKKRGGLYLLAAAIVGTFLLIVSLFLFLDYYLEKQSRQEVEKISQVYMQGISERNAKQFRSLVDMHLDHVEEIVRQNRYAGAEEDANVSPAEYAARMRKLHESLSRAGKPFGFEYMGFYAADGSFEMIYGGMVRLTSPEAFHRSALNEESKVAAGLNPNNENIILLSAPARYPMRSGQLSISLVAGYPAEFFIDSLSLNEEVILVSSLIIRMDGSYIIRAKTENYFDRVRRLYLEGGGDMAAGEEYITSLHNAMVNNEDFSYKVNFGPGLDDQFVFCARIPQSEWYLLTVLPYSVISETVNAATTENFHIELLVLGIIVLLFVCVFLLYYRISKAQMEEMNRAREEAERANRAKSDFLSNMSHDIRTPMNAIQGMTAIAQAHMDNPEQVRNALNKISLSGRHLLGLINDILDMSKIESGKMKLNEDRTSLREIMESIVSITQPQMKEKRQFFEVSVRNIHNEYVHCDGVRLNQVIINLMSNAIKYTPEEGKITLTLTESISEKGDDYVHISIRVRDTGIGMDMEYKEHIFEAFTREDTKRVHKIQGTGLGMAITKYIVDAMEGTIDFDSEKGKGTEFKVELDLKKESDMEIGEMKLPSSRVMVVDDDKALLEGTVETLALFGLTSKTFLNGEGAIEELNTNSDYQLVVLDWQLPGIDGIETARRIHARLNIPIVMITAYDYSDVEDEAREAGITGFITKPLFRSTLYYGLRPQLVKEEIKYDNDNDQIGNLEGRKILLAEDNELNWEVAEELLGDCGAELEWAENGKIAVEKFAQSEPGYYDAILMDIRMPEMDGYTATEQIRLLEREDAKTIPIIAMTADAFADDVKRALDAGMSAHVSKPIDIKEVSKLLERYLK